MPQAKLSGSGSRRTPRHTWTQDQKRCVLLLFTDFQHVPQNEAAAIFHRVFKHEIDPVGFPDGLPYKSLRSQWSESRQEDNVRWAKITRPESREWEAKRREEIAVEIRKCLAGEPPEIITPMPVRAPPSPVASRKRKAEALVEDRNYVSSWNDLPPLAVQTRAARRAQVMPTVRQAGPDERARETTPPNREPMIMPAVVIQSTESRRAQTQMAATRTQVVARSSTPRTPKSSRRTMPQGFTRIGPRRPPGMALFERAHGPPIWLWPAELERAKKGWIAPTSKEAHPPLAGLFFRFWDAGHSRARMQDDGIVAEKYASSNCIPPSPPPVEYLDCNDVLVHLDRESQTERGIGHALTDLLAEQKKETPFVSVSDSLVWSLSKVLKKVKGISIAKGETWLDAQVSVIDAHALQANAVFHALPF